MTVKYNDGVSEYATRAAFVTLRPVKALTDSRRWAATMGAGILLDGGVEMHIRDQTFDREMDALLGKENGAAMDSWIPLTIADSYLPEMDVRVKLNDLITACERIAKGTGPRNGVERKACAHATLRKGCPACFCRWWTERETQVA